jgi:signal transduction histidine kinase
VSGSSESPRFALELDPALPPVAVNEFVVWEVLEPIIQNSVDHAAVDRLVITIRTHSDPSRKVSTITIADNGVGIAPGLLERDEKGIQLLFHEHVSTKSSGEKQHSGYGCYISHEIATQRCGWHMHAANLDGGGCAFAITLSQPS